jgi:membrane associated rhomboid family serine protease
MSALPPPPPPATPPASAPGSAADTHTCYRHTKRPAGRQCTRCGKYACAECLVQASIGSHCLDCAKASRPAAATRARHWNARQPTLVTSALIAVNLLVFVYGAIVDPKSISGNLTTVHEDLALWRPFLEQRDEWYRLVTSGFLHYGIIHLGFNMYMLYLLGQMLEPALGRVRFLLLYFASLLGGSLGVLLLDDGLAAGASGAVFGLLGAAFVGQWLHGANPLSTSIGSVLVMNLFITFAWRNQISVGGHVGGLVAGAICGAALLAPRHKGVPRWAGYAVPALVIVAATVGAVAYTS